MRLATRDILRHTRRPNNTVLSSFIGVVAVSSDVDREIAVLLFFCKSEPHRHDIQGTSPSASTSLQLTWPVSSTSDERPAVCAGDVEECSRAPVERPDPATTGSRGLPALTTASCYYSRSQLVRSIAECTS
ncbi:hypothetical protein NP493_162g02041 [Ridgeia piscesae]|uniref:Uncharacterized protein n=1 Tax=Ridgeia piscesae TaxID=27915 RepID=A0AAD9P3K5_RIDPI|nr:hypothetical protein NP493_162g02041 [Ridgeia piscesae]